MFEIWSSRKYLSQNDSMNSMNFSQDDSFEHTNSSIKSSFDTFFILWNSNSLVQTEYAHHKTPHENSKYWGKSVLLCLKSEVYVQRAGMGAQEGNYANIILNGNTLYLSSPAPAPPGLLSCTFLTVLVSQCPLFTPLNAHLSIPPTLGLVTLLTCLDARCRHFLLTIIVSLITLLWVFFPIKLTRSS